MSEKRKKNLSLFPNILFEAVPVGMLNAVLAALLHFFEKKPNFFAQGPELNKKLDSSFWQPCWKIIDWMPKKVKKFALCAKMIQSIWFFFQKNYSKWSYRRVKSSFHKPAEKFLSEDLFFSLISEDDKNTYNFFKKIFFFQVFLWTRRIQFWQSCGKSFDKIPKIFPQKTKRKKIYIFSKKTWLECSWGHVEYCVLQRKNFVLVVQKWQTKVFFSNNSPQNLSIET